MLEFFNTLTRKKEEFHSIRKGHVTLYTCGPTVYNYAHIGNFRAYVFGDLLKRYLKYKGYSVRHAMNLTDVDDKTIKGAVAEGVSLKEFTERYSKFFFEDVKTLNIQPADVYPKATGHIPEMVGIIKKLLANGVAYQTSDGIYFAIKKFDGYGRLALLEKTQLIEGARVSRDEYDKESVQDFALWKFWDKEDGDVFWETEIGKGRPGWHIECSAMSTKYLGQPFDMHTGGVDLIFPHHENEISQSEGAEGRKFVNFWLHCAHLVVDRKKMSKSLGNFYTLRDVLQRGSSPMAIRYLLLSTHYRQQLNFTFDEVKAAERTVDSLVDFIRRLREVSGSAASADREAVAKLGAKALEGFEQALDDDLEISPALAAVHEYAHDVNRLLAAGRLDKESAAHVIGVMEKFDSVLGVMGYVEEEIPTDVKALIDKREAARKAGDWREADRIREVLRQQGVILEDAKEGVRWRRFSQS
ncbi:cysteine--tRNA ligase [Candidatus Woesearchaeota archaeon]|nr:cysteine--tRNA ligase [Candidatus Woesearchaeota archaeon]